MKISPSKIQSVPGGNFSILKGHSIGHSKQKSTCVLLRTASEIVISLHSSKIVDKKEILRIVSNADIYCSSEKVGTVYLL
jgi:hypothetical protein